MLSQQTRDPDMTLWQRLQLQWLPAVILLLTAGLYVQVSQHTLVWDEHSLTAQQVVHQPSWTHYQRSAQEARRPLALVSVIIDRFIWQGLPAGYAVDSLLYHLVVVALFFYLIRGWVGPFAAAASTLVVALHPAGAETVHYLLGRPDLLSAACILAALLAFRQLNHTHRPSVTLALFWGFGLLSFAAKETAILLPWLAFFLFFTPTGSAGGDSAQRRTRLIAMIPLLALFSLYLIGRLSGWVTIGAPMRLHVGVESLAMMAATAGTALAELLLPITLCPWYEGLIVVPSSIWPAAAALLIGLAGALSLMWWCRLRAPAVSLGLAWMTGIVMVIAIRAASEPSPMNPLAVRWLYPAVLGAALVIGGTLQWAGPLCPRMSRVAAVCVALLLMGLSWQAQSIWQRDLSLFQRAAECNPRSTFIALQYIDALDAAGRKDDAGRLFDRLRLQQPDHPMVLSRLIRLAIDRGDYTMALELSRTLTRVAPSLNSYQMLGDLMAMTDQSEMAVGAYRAAMRYDPRNMLTLTALGSAYEKTRQWDAAAALYQNGLTDHPKAANLWFRLGRVAEQTGRLEEAARAFDQVTQLDQYCPDGYLAEARVLRQIGDTRSADAAAGRYALLAGQPAVPRPTFDPLDSPCGMEPKVIYPKRTGAMSLSPGPAPPVPH
jgi:Flp pilus assembly protein TadD